MTKSFFEELQSLNEGTKRKVAIVATIVLMVGVVYVWLGYFNGLVAGSSGSTGNAGNSEISQQQPTPVGQTQQNQSAPSSWMAALGNGFAGAATRVADLFKNFGQYNIKPSQ